MLKSDDNTQTDTGQTDDTQVDDNQTTDTAEQTDGEFMEDAVKEIKETQKAILGDDNTDDNTDDTESDDNTASSELAGTDIPDAFSEAALASGMTPAEMTAFADKHTDEELMEMIPTLEASLDDKSSNDDVDDKDTKQDDKATKDADNKDIDPELEAKITEVAKQLEDKFGATLEEIEKFKAYQKEQSDKQAVDTASKAFDAAFKEFPVFGKTEELPKFTSGRLAGQLIPTSPAMKARLEVLGYADAFMGKGADMDNAMTNALATYKGLHLEKELERKQVRDLKNHETKLSGARTGKETKKKYADSRDEIIDDIKEMQRAAGIG